MRGAKGSTHRSVVERTVSVYMFKNKSVYASDVRKRKRSKKPHDWGVYYTGAVLIFTTLKNTFGRVTAAYASYRYVSTGCSKPDVL